MSSEFAAQVPEPLHVASTVKSIPKGESPGELLEPAEITMSHPLKFELEYIVVPLPLTVTVVAPVLCTWMESAFTKDGAKTNITATCPQPRILHEAPSRYRSVKR